MACNFATNLDDAELDDFIEDNRTVNTVKKTQSDLKVWKRCCASINESRDLVEIPTNELNGLLAHFAMRVRRLDGTEYEPNSISSFFKSFDRHLKNKGQVRSIIADREFAKARDVLEAKRKELKKKGKGRKDNAAEPLTEDEEDLLWKAKQLGSDSPQTLIQTVWYYNTMHFG